MTNAEIFKLAEETGGNIFALARAVAKLQREKDAEFVDHILREGGGTYGGLIRNQGDE